MAQGLAAPASPKVSYSDRKDSSSSNDIRKRWETVKMPSTPPKLSHSGIDGADDSMSPHPARARLNSREYTHSYDGNYGAGNDDMVGVDIARESGSWWQHQQGFLLVSYVIVVLVVGLIVTMALAPLSNDSINVKLSGTVTNFLHFIVTLIYFHWLKGGTHEDQGELDHLTLWEQLEATPGTGTLRFVLRLTPTLLCYIACIEAGWGQAKGLCSVNVGIWSLTMLGKMPFMNGVRIFGINKHPVIDSR
jgi:hypothetical protein